MAGRRGFRRYRATSKTKNERRRIFSVAQEHVGRDIVFSDKRTSLPAQRRKLTSECSGLPNIRANQPYRQLLTQNSSYAVVMVECTT